VSAEASSSEVAQASEKKTPQMGALQQSTQVTPSIIYDRNLRPLADLRISLTDRCNLRCPYCMPCHGPRKADFSNPECWLNFDEITRIVTVCAGLGVSKVRVTGGEPLLRSGMCDLVDNLAAVPGIQDLALTTNGTLLLEKLALLKQSGLKRLTISLDTLDPLKFKKLSGEAALLQKLLLTIDEAARLGFQPIKINTVIVRGFNEEDILPLVKYFRCSGHILRFIEYMDTGSLHPWERNKVFEDQELFKKVHALYPLEPLAATRFGEVARRYRYQDGGGEVGFISPISQPFCQTCTRLRLTVDGKLLGCLFSSHGLNLRGPLRQGASDKDLTELIQTFWQARADRYSETRHYLQNYGTAKRMEMFQVGG